METPHLLTLTANGRELLTDLEKNDTDKLMGMLVNYGRGGAVRQSSAPGASAGASAGSGAAPASGEVSRFATATGRLALG